MERFSTVSTEGAWRLGYIELAWRFFSENPLIGVGIGDFAGAINSLEDRTQIPGTLRNSTQFSTVHNIYLQFLAETGFIGWLLWSIISIVVMVIVWQYFSKRDSNLEHKILYSWLMIAWIGFSFNANFEAVFFHHSIIMALFAILGIIVTLWVQVENPFEISIGRK